MKKIIENLNCVVIILIYLLLLLSIPIVLIVELMINLVYKVAVYLKIKKQKEPYY
jgi:hypothetical protein